MNVLSIRGLGRRFGAVPALSDFDLDVPVGSRTAVVGPSGSGKTTLLRLIAGFEVPDTGEIELDGQRIADRNTGVPPHRRNIGLVMQEGALFPHLSVLDNIRFGIRERAGSEASAMVLLDLVELPRTMAVRAPHQLSGGQQQRVALARALARQPRLMLLDEPFSALDTGLRDQLRQATADILTRAGVATLLVTHDRDEAMEFADQLVVLHEGRLAQAGPPRDVYSYPRDPATAAFLGEALILDADIRDGTAHCLLGAIPLVSAQSSLAGRTAILLRPEQLSLSVSADRATDWSIQSLRFSGPVVRATIAHRAGQVALTFETKLFATAAAGAPVHVRVDGSAWAFPVGTVEQRP